MTKLTDNDKNLGPITIGKWTKTFELVIRSGDDEDSSNSLLAVGFGWAIRVKIPRLIKPFGKYREHSQTYGLSLSNMGNGYDFFQLYYGPQTHDSSTTKSWCKHLPWKQWRHIRHSIYTPMGDHFYTEQRGADFREYWNKKESCPKSYFGFEDFDGELVVATCTIEEREWQKGEGWFKWLRFFNKPKIVRSLDLVFSAEVGPEKGSWKGGTIGHGIDMLEGEIPEAAFKRYCELDHERKRKHYKLRFIGPCNEPAKKEKIIISDNAVENKSL